MRTYMLTRLEVPRTDELHTDSYSIGSFERNNLCHVTWNLATFHLDIPAEDPENSHYSVEHPNRDGDVRVGDLRQLVNDKMPVNANHEENDQDLVKR